MTRADRAKQAEAEALAVLKAKRAARIQEERRVQAKARTRDRKALKDRRYRVGCWVEAAGLFMLEDGVLGTLLQTLAPLASLPDPVAVLDDLLSEVSVSTLPEET